MAKKPPFQRNVYVYMQLLSFALPLFGYAIDFNYRTGPAFFIVFTLMGIALFIWGYVRYKKANGKKELRAVDWIGKGCIMQIAGNHQEAVIAFTRACELDHGAVLAYYSRGRSYWELGNLNQAINDFNRAIELNPGFAEAYDKRGLCHAKSGNNEQAVKDFDKAIELNARFAMAYMNRGASHGMLGNREQEVLDTQAAARLGMEAAQKLLKSKGIDW